MDDKGILTSKPEVRFIPKKEAGTVDIISAKDATATSSSTRIILLRMVSSCMAHISRVLFMFSTISCRSASSDLKPDLCCPSNTCRGAQ